MAHAQPRTDPLEWLAARDEYPKVLVHDLGTGDFLAGAGAADFLGVAQPTTTAVLEARLAERVGDLPTGHPGWVGGVRFAPERASRPSWSSFGAGWWVLPEHWLSSTAGVLCVGYRARSVEVPSHAAALEPDEPRETYLERVRAALEELGSTALEKVVLARSARREGRVDVVATLTKLSQLERRGTVYWLAPTAHEGFFGVTPETLYRRTGTAVRAEALAGTVGRAARPAADGRCATELANDAKSGREHAFVRDAIVAALEPLSASLSRPDAPSVRSLARVHHLFTPIECRLREPRMLLAHLHPTPAVCGTPYALAEAAIARLESVDRGFYAGAIGWWRRDGEAVYVALRGARYVGDAASVLVGAGIVEGSVPELELAELDAKAAALIDCWTASRPSAQQRPTSER
ncbi:MAG: isochorismate synthase [Planctomycetota bacterium]